MVRGSVLADEQPFADLAVGQPIRDEPEHLDLAFGQPVGEDRGRWSSTISCTNGRAIAGPYTKLRLDPAWIAGVLRDRDLAVEAGTSPGGLVQVVARRP